MASKCWIKTYFRWFHLFGLFLKRPISSPNKKISKFKKIAPIIVHSVFVILSIALLVRDLINKSANVDSYTNIATCATVMPNVIYLFEMCLSDTKVEDILLELKQSKVHLLKYLNVSVKLNRLKISTGIKFLLMIVIVGMLFFMKIILGSTLVSTQYDVLNFVLVFYKRFGVFLLVLLIDFESILLNSLNQRLEYLRLNFDQDRIDSVVFEVVYLFHHIRLVHLKLNNVSTMINSRFGWFLIAVLLDYFNHITNGIINAIRNTFRFRQMEGLLRKNYAIC